MKVCPRVFSDTLGFFCSHVRLLSSGRFDLPHRASFRLALRGPAILRYRDHASSRHKRRQPLFLTPTELFCACLIRSI